MSNVAENVRYLVVPAAERNLATLDHRSQGTVRDDIILGPNEGQDNHGNRRSMFRAGSGVCRQQTDSNVLAAKVGRLVPSARKANL
jgi:hypothetical protein